MISPKLHPILAATVRRLDKAQPMSLCTLLREVPDLTTFAVKVAVKNNYIYNAAVQGQPARYAATNPGRERYGIPIEGLSRTPSRLYVSTDTYDGADLRPFTGRAGANDAIAIKSFGFGT